MDMALHIMDGEHGTLDPAFQGNSAVVVHWAKAIWENWIPELELKRAFAEATTAMDGKGNSAWQRVRGPTMAMIATLDRVGWWAKSHTLLVDDVGDTHDLTLDPPIAIKQAMDRTTRRWRLHRISKDLPELIPDDTDDWHRSSTSAPRSTAIIDLVSTGMLPCQGWCKCCSMSSNLFNALYFVRKIILTFLKVS